VGGVKVSVVRGLLKGMGFFGGAIGRDTAPRRVLYTCDERGHVLNLPVDTNVVAPGSSARVAADGSWWVLRTDGVWGELPPDGAGVELAEIDLDDTEALPADEGENKGSILQTFGRLGHMLRLITGKTRWWTPPVKSIEELNSQNINLENSLSEKVDGKYHIYRNWGELELPVSASFNDIANAMKPYSTACLYIAGGNNVGININPYNTGYSTNTTDSSGFVMVSKDWGNAFIKWNFTNHNGSCFWQGYYNSSIAAGGFTGWKRLAIAESPTLIPFLFDPGWSASQVSSRYFKTQENVVTCLLNFIKTTDIVQNEKICTIPYGYRINGRFDKIALYSKDDGTPVVTGSIVFHSGGEIFTGSIQPNARRILCDLTYVAVS